MKTVIRLFLLAFMLGLAGCSDASYHRLYEGIRMRNDGFKSPEERAMNPTPSYSSYKKERDELEK